MNKVRNFQQAIDTLIRLTAINFVAIGGQGLTQKIRMLNLAGLNIKEIAEVVGLTQKSIKHLLKK